MRTAGLLTPVAAEPRTIKTELDVELLKHAQCGLSMSCGALAIEVAECYHEQLGAAGGRM